MAEAASDYNVVEVYDKQIAPLIKALHKVCRENDVPYVASFAVRNDPRRRRTEYRTEGNPTGMTNVVLYDDRLADFLLVLNGAEVGMVKDDTGAERPSALPFSSSNAIDAAAESYIRDADFDAADEDAGVPAEKPKGAVVVHSIDTPQANHVDDGIIDIVGIL